MTTSGIESSIQVSIACGGEDVLDRLFRYDDEVRCHGVLEVNLEGIDGLQNLAPQASERIASELARAGWAVVEVPPLLPSLEQLWCTTGNRVVYLCPVCEATRRRALADPDRPRPQIAWDVWTEADVAARREEIAVVTQVASNTTPWTLMLSFKLAPHRAEQEAKQAVVSAYELGVRAGRERLDARWAALEKAALEIPLGASFQSGALVGAPMFDVAMAALRYARGESSLLDIIVEAKDD